VRQLQDTPRNVANQLWVLQVVGSNPAAPTSQVVESSRCDSEILAAILTRGWPAIPNRRPTPRPNRSAAEADPRVRQLNRAIAEGLEPGPQPL
jgi:hypothetical protein